MERSEIERLIYEKILEHERRIGWISGIAGLSSWRSFFF